MARFRESDHPRDPRTGRFINKNGSKSRANANSIGSVIKVTVVGSLVLGGLDVAGVIDTPIFGGTPSVRTVSVESPASGTRSSQPLRLELAVAAVRERALKNNRKQVDILLDIANNSEDSAQLQGRDQILFASDGSEFSAKDATITIDANISKQVKLSFVIPDDDEPAELTINLEGKKGSLSLTGG